MGAVGLTFVIVAAFLGFVMTRGGQLEPGNPGTESDLVDQDAASPAAAPADASADAGTVNAAVPPSAAPSDDEPDASAADAAPEPVASGTPTKKPPPTKTKYKPPTKWRRHR